MRKTVTTAALALVLMNCGLIGDSQAATSETSAQSAERPAWYDEEVVAAAIRIGMNESQQPQFRDSVTLFLTSFGQEVDKLVRRGVPNLENEVKRKRKSLTREMDARMAGFLDEGQMSRYGEYRDLLLSKLSR